MKDNRSITFGYDEASDKFTVIGNEFDSMQELGEAVAELNLAVIKVLS